MQKIETELKCVASKELQEVLELELSEERVEADIEELIEKNEIKNTGADRNIDRPNN